MNLSCVAYSYNSSKDQRIQWVSLSGLPMAQATGATLASREGRTVEKRLTSSESIGTALPTCSNLVAVEHI